MTTAHRPTWKAAVGRAQEGAWSSGGKPSLQSSAKDAPAHTKLKFRTGPQATGALGSGGSDRKSELLKESLLRMEEAERSAAISNVRRVVRAGRRDQLLLMEKGEEESKLKLLKQTADVDDELIRAKYDDEDADNGDDAGGWSDIDDNKAKLNSDDESDLDASDDDDNDDDSDLDDSDDEDEEAALQAELAKIRNERAAMKARADAEAAADEQAQMEEAALTGNPLLNSTASSSLNGKLKRRWNDDVVFRNQARSEPDQNKKRFINDTVRNDFHKRFLNKFMK
jgi:protein CWC15